MAWPVRIHPDVARALSENIPVVALESTLLVHGLPASRSPEVAEEIEDLVRSQGAVPATIGVRAGEAVIGVSTDELQYLVERGDVPKLSVRDLAVAIAAGGDGATTVAATSLLAAHAGIRVFATGGLGGVHRDARTTWDESADLVTLSQVPITVVSAGVKSILDIGATLERLESLNVAVVGYRTYQFPGFYLSDSGHSLDWSLESPEQVARAMVAQAALGSSSALIVANPIPVEQQLGRDLHDRVLEQGLKEAKQRGVRGKAVTPFLLDYFHRTTEDESLRVNIQIILQNADLASRIARAFCAVSGSTLAGAS